MQAESINKVKIRKPQLPIQASLKIGRPGDKYEQEADRVADYVMRLSSVEPIRMQTQEEEEELQMKCVNCEEDELQMKPELQFKNGTPFEASPDVSNKIRSTKGNGSALTPALQREMSTKIGADFSGVNIHTGSDAVQMNRELGARAFTQGKDIYFNSGEYKPSSSEGKHLLAHELTHVVQKQPDIQMAEIDDNPALCSELDDSREQINTYVNAVINQTRNITDGVQRVQFVFERIGRGSPYSAIEDWCEQLPENLQRRVPINQTRFQENLVASRGPAWLKGEKTIGTLLNVNGTCIGSDKLGHFFQQGRDYFQISEVMGRGDQYANWYGEWLEGILPTDAGFRTWLEEMDDADWPGFDSLMLGANPWRGVYGLTTTGVYSRGDLAANSGGLEFYKQIHSNPNYTFDIRNFIDGTWNERQNSSCFTDNMRRIVTANDPAVNREYREAVERMIYPDGRNSRPRMVSPYAGAHLLRSIIERNLSRFEQCGP